MMDSIAFEPARDEFDVAAIEGYLESLGNHAARDPQERRRFLLCVDPQTLHEAIEERRAGSGSISSEVIVLFPTAVRILLGIRTTDTGPAKVFTKWLRDRYDIKILDNEFNDSTEKYRDNLDLLFGAES